MRSSRRPSLVLAAVAVVALGLTACTPTPQQTSSPSPLPSATSTPTPAPTGPVAAFGGDCAAVVDTAEISAAMGEEMAFWEPTWVDGADAGLGGVQCGWTSEQYLSGFTTVWAYPVSVLDPAYVSGAASNSCDAVDPICTVSEVFGDTWVGMQAYSDTAAQQIENLRPVLAEIGERATHAPTPTPGSLEGWWSPVVTCEELAATLTDGGVPSTSTDDRPASAPVFVDGPRSRGCSIDVTIQGEQRSVALYMDAGAGDGMDSVLTLDPSQRIEYDGRTFASAAEQYQIDGNPGLLLGSDGVNLVSLLRGDWDGGTMLDAPILAAVLTALEG